MKFRYAMRLFVYSILWMILLSCQDDDLLAVEGPNTKSYIFLGHTYDWQRADRVDPRIEKLDLSIYDNIWLGGDICASTTKNIETFDYLESLFHISASTTYWAIGNHDIRAGNPERITQATGRDLYYTHHADGITYLVLNSILNDTLFNGDCDYIEGQFNMIQHTLDTLNESTHLVFLMHYVLWLNCEEDMDVGQAANADASWLGLSCVPFNQFSRAIYPRLIDIQNAGTQVVVISGDGGQYGKKYEYTTSEGIEFYISGINNSIDMTNDFLVDKFNTNPDSVLIFTHDLQNKSLQGSFYKLNDL